MSNKMSEILCGMYVLLEQMMESLKYDWKLDFGAYKNPLPPMINTLCDYSGHYFQKIYQEHPMRKHVTKLLNKSSARIVPRIFKYEESLLRYLDLSDYIIVMGQENHNLAEELSKYVHSSVQYRNKMAALEVLMFQGGYTPCLNPNILITIRAYFQSTLDYVHLISRHLPEEMSPRRILNEIREGTLINEYDVPFEESLYYRNLTSVLRQIDKKSEHRIDVDRSCLSVYRTNRGTILFDHYNVS